MTTTTTDCACPLTVVARCLGGLAPDSLWWAYLECGGNRSRADLTAYLDGIARWPNHEHNALSQALNEALWDIGSPSLAPIRTGGDVPR
ncbi:hypothetical protein [Blastococcus sp. KM273129]|uniref:hypothetical protein n=1 Tax=Blastococcus sp. KM273129 TaxID=2570315 RepID=UPI001F34C327|nr:hypothetical protein [Blastococcus sp. KM273129]MCF6734119.1 hypothetical protein [Blastococcus sp. KM273129]